jgi:hypothetical protein
MFYYIQRGYNILEFALVLTATVRLWLSSFQVYFLSLDKKDTGTEVSVKCSTDVAAETMQLCPAKCTAASQHHDWYIGCITAHNGKMFL